MVVLEGDHLDGLSSKKIIHKMNFILMKLTQVIILNTIVKEVIIM